MKGYVIARAVLTAAGGLLYLSLDFARIDAAVQPPAGEPLAIIVNQANPVTDLTSAELRRIFVLDVQTWPHGRRITVVHRAVGEPERAQAIAAVTAMSEAEYARHILLQTFRGRISIEPRAVRLASAMQRFVFNAPGAIGYVSARDVNSSIRVLRIDGRLPADVRYPLRMADVN